jgi:hypothetical protein
MARWSLPALPLAALALVSGCNRYEMFRLAGFAQDEFTNEAEILFVIDNSSSMTAESADLGVNFDTFIGQLIDPDGDGGGLDGLVDAVDDYILSQARRGSVIDFQLGVTTTDVAADYGRLYSFSGEPIVRRSTPDLTNAFRKNLLCEATCFQGPNGSLPSAVEVDRADYVCGDPLDSDQLFFEYMDCTCGEDVWVGNCGSGDEEHIEAVFLAMCRGVDPADDSQATQLLLEACEDKTPFTRAADGGSSSEFFREGSIVIPVIVTDAGDGSRRLATGEADPDPYPELFDLFGRRMAWAVIGPTVEGCRTAGAENPQPWQIARYEYFVEDSDGLYADIATSTDDGGCEVSDFAVVLEQLGTLLNSLLRVFPLQAVPDVETLRVFVDGKEVDPAPITRDEDSGEITYGDGWSYQSAENAVEFHGSAIPDYSAQVRIYYLPLAGMPRTLPF